MTSSLLISHEADKNHVRWGLAAPHQHKESHGCTRPPFHLPTMSGAGGPRRRFFRPSKPSSTARPTPSLAMRRFNNEPAQSVIARVNDNNRYHFDQLHRIKAIALAARSAASASPCKRPASISFPSSRSCSSAPRWNRCRIASIFAVSSTLSGARLQDGDG